MGLNKNEVIKTLKGYERGAAFARKERLEQLSSLSSQESLAIFLDLWKVWGKNRRSANSKKLEQLKLKRLIERRKNIDKLAHLNEAHDRST